MLWGAPRIHGELLKLGFAVAQSTVAKYMAMNGDPSDQSWGHLPQVLKSYASYYNTARTHRSLDKDAPVSRPI